MVANLIGNFPAIHDLFRWLNLGIAIVVFVWLSYRRLRHPDWYRRGGLRRDIWVMAFLWDLAALTANIENLAGSTTYIRVGMATAALITTLAILLRPAKDWPGPND